MVYLYRRVSHSQQRFRSLQQATDLPRLRHLYRQLRNHLHIRGYSDTQDLKAAWHANQQVSVSHLSRPRNHHTHRQPVPQPHP